MTSADCCNKNNLTIISNSDIEIRFKLRDEINQELADSVGEHGILVPPIVLELTSSLKSFFKTDKDFLCLDGHSRIMEMPKEMKIECLVLTWDELRHHSEKVLHKAGVDTSTLQPDEVILGYILRLHACRLPLPRTAYVMATKKLMAKGVSIRQAAALLGVAKTSLHRWTHKEDLTDEDFEADSARTRKLCGFCGQWIAKGAKPIWFHLKCYNRVAEILEKLKGGGEKDE